MLLCLRLILGNLDFDFDAFGWVCVGGVFMIIFLKDIFITIFFMQHRYGEI